jgi:hypothetical protein
MGISELALIECPRCGSLSCEQNGFDLLCPNCLYHEPDHSLPRIGSLASVPPSDAMAPDLWELSQTENLGEFIEQIPSDLSRWNLSLGDERILRMTEQAQDNESNSFPKKEVPPYELVAFPDEEKGTTWMRHGVAWPTKDGKRLRIKIFMDKPLPENGKLLLVESLKASARARSEEVSF